MGKSKGKQKEQEKQSSILIDADGMIPCPDCGESVKVGTGGEENLNQHRKSKGCLKVQNAKKREEKTKPQKKLFDLWRPNDLKANLVPSTVKAATKVKAFLASPPTSSAPPSPRQADSSVNPRSSSKFPSTLANESTLHLFARKVNSYRLDCLSIGDSQGPFGMFGAEPSDVDIGDAESDWQWLDGQLTVLLGYGTTVEELSVKLKRRKFGVEGLVKFLLYFVEKRSIDPALLEGKLERLEKAIQIRCGEIREEPMLKPIGSRRPFIPPPLSPPATCETHDIIDVDTIPDPTRRCSGFHLTFPPQQTPYSSYPFALHDHYMLPWNVSIQNGMMHLFHRDCRVEIQEDRECCHACESLSSNDVLEGITARIENGVHENSPWIFHSLNGLKEIAHRRTDQFDTLRLRHLRNSQKLLVMQRNLDNTKRFIMAIGSGEYE
ncbi:hypothetical protein PM082_014415 [Marasmius tenuissimus]|nr:hypothetical protein PM082_014415 [Marasmius tenuissimus]